MDLDQGGRGFQGARVYLGPSLGWAHEQVQPSTTVLVGGTYNVQAGDSLILVNVNAAVTIQLPDTTKWIPQVANQPATAFAKSITVKDLGGFAATNAITIAPFGSQKIDNGGSISIVTGGGSFTLVPLIDQSGWTVQVGTLGSGGAPTNAEYITSSTNAGLTAERVLTNTPSIAWDFTTPGQAKASVLAGGGGIGWPNTISIADPAFAGGAKGDGVTDDTAAINAAYASLQGTAGLVLWPAGTYKTTNSILIGGPDTTGTLTSFISTICPAGPIRTVVNYNGPTDGRGAVRYCRNKYAHMYGLGIVDPRGISVATGTGNSSSSTSLTVSGVTGVIQIGSFIYGNDVNTLFNTLVITGQTSGTPGGNGVYTTNNLTTVGGTALSFFPPTRGLSLGGAVGDFGNWCLQCSFDNVSVGGGFCMGVTEGFGVPLSGNLGGACSEAVFTHLQITGNTHGAIFNDFNSLDNQFISLSMTGNNIGVDTGAIDSIWVFGGSSSGNGNDFFIQQNSDLNVYSYRSEGASTCINSASGVQVGGVVCHDVRMRAIQGPVATRQAISGHPISMRLYGCEIDGNIVISNLGNLPLFIDMENCNLFPDANGFPFAWGGGSNQFANNRAQVRFRGCTPHINAVNTNVNVPDFIGYINGANDGNMVFDPLNNIFTDTTFGGGNFPLGVPYQSLYRVRNISEGPMPGAFTGTTGPVATAGGKNIRITAKFAGSTPITVNFVRATGTVLSGPGGGILNSSSAIFVASDAGKPVIIPGKGNQSQTDWKGSITQVNSSTQVIAIPQRPQQDLILSAGTPAAGSIGENEPDANYIVTGLCGSANETFWVSAQTNTGFTLNSSNATSTATVNCMIVR